MPKDLGEIAATAAENKEIAAMGIAVETFLNLQSQSLHSATHIRVASRDPDPTSLGNGNQDRSAFNVAVINAVDAFAPILIRASLISTRIAPRSDSPAGDSFAIGGSGGDSTTT